MMLTTLMGAFGTGTIHAEGLAMVQAQDMINSGNSKLLEIFIGIAAIALFAQAVAVVGIAVAAYKAQKRAMQIVEELRGKVMPLAAKSHTLLDELGPKITSITANVEHISLLIKEKAQDFEPTIDAANVTIREANQTVRDANAKAQQQIVRVNGMITSALTATSDVAEKIHHGIRVPVREVSAIVSGVKATLESLVSKTRGFGDGIKPNPARTSPFAQSGYKARPASSVVRPPHSSGLEVVPTENDREIGI